MRKKELEGYKIVSIHVHGDTWKQFCGLVKETYNERESASGMIQKFMGKYIKDEVIFVPEEPEEDDLSFDLTLEEALDLFDLGQKLARRCGQMLDSADLRVQQLGPDGTPGPLD